MASGLFYSQALTCLAVLISDVVISGVAAQRSRDRTPAENIAGIAFGVIFIICVIVACCACSYRYRRRQIVTTRSTAVLVVGQTGGQNCAPQPNPNVPYRAAATASGQSYPAPPQPLVAKAYPEQPAPVPAYPVQQHPAAPQYPAAGAHYTNQQYPPPVPGAYKPPAAGAAAYPEPSAPGSDLDKAGAPPTYRDAVYGDATQSKPGY